MRVQHSLVRAYALSNLVSLNQSRIQKRDGVYVCVCVEQLCT